MYKSDYAIEREFDNSKIGIITLNPSGISGRIEVLFPNGGESVGGGADCVNDSWIKYDNGKIAFDNWYPEKIYFLLVSAIKAKLKLDK